MSPYFDRFDICEAYALLEMDYHKGGWLQERPSNRRRKESIGVQLNRLGFAAGPGFGWTFDSLSENSQEIYLQAAHRMGLPVCESPNHQQGKPAESLWTCEQCSKRCCATCEGGDDSHPDFCDDCWAKIRGLS